MSQESKLPVKAAPESEDEAFLCWWMSKDGRRILALGSYGDVAKAAYLAGYARARLDAERER